MFPLQGGHHMTDIVKKNLKDCRKTTAHISAIQIHQVIYLILKVARSAYIINVYLLQEYCCYFLCHVLMLMLTYTFWHCSFINEWFTNKLPTQSIIQQFSFLVRYICYFQTYIKLLQQTDPSLHSTAVAIPAYVEECCQLCWLMCIQDPPVVLGPSVTQGHMFDTSLYRAYTQTGPYIDYEVWPPLYLCEGGSILSKGVVQGLR